MLTTLILSFALSSSECLRPNRYTCVRVSLSTSQVDPLSERGRLSLTSASTVGDAVRLAIAGTGYTLSDPVPGLSSYLAQPLPAIQRTLGRLSRRQALTMFGGTAWRLVEDPVHRRVAYVRRPAIRSEGAQ